MKFIAENLLSHECVHRYELIGIDHSFSPITSDLWHVNVTEGMGVKKGKEGADY